MSDIVNIGDPNDYPLDWVDCYSDYDGPCLVLGNGPSIKTLDLEHPKLSNAFTIGTNAIGMVHTPDFYIITDNRAWDWYHDIMMKCVNQWSLFIMGQILYDRLRNEGNKKPIPPNTYLLRYERKNIYGVPEKYGPIYHARTVGMVALCLAFQLGFKKTYILGIDGFGCKTPDTHFHNEHKEENNTVVKADERDDVVSKQLINLSKAFAKHGQELKDLSTISVWGDIVEKETLE